jgi:magnesium transporter
MTTTLLNTIEKRKFISINHNLTAEQTIDYIKNFPSKTTNSILYVVDDNNCLLGILHLGSLLVSNYYSKIHEIMDDDYDFISEDSLNDQNLVKLFYKHNAIELPLLNKNNELLDVINIHYALTQKYNFSKNDSSASKSVYMHSTLCNIKNSSFFILYKSRTPWLLILIFMNIFSGAGIAAFEDTIASSIVLIFFLPLLIDSAGNAGSQSSTLVIRSLALGNVKLKDWFSLFNKEILLSLIIGLSMALVVFPLGIWRGGIELAVIVGLTMFVVVILGSLIGISLPFLFQKLKLDPATASGPLVTSLADIVGVLVYFSIATFIFSLSI